MKTSSLQNFNFTPNSLVEKFAAGDWNCHFKKNAFKVWKSNFRFL